MLLLLRRLGLGGMGMRGAISTHRAWSRIRGILGGIVRGILGIAVGSVRVLLAIITVV